MMAANGMMNGGGIGVNTDMTSQISSAASNPISTMMTSLQVAAANANVALGTALSSLPSAFTSVVSTGAAAAAQAAQMAPDVKTFISLQSAATAFGSASAEYGAALSEFGTKTFSDLGIGVSSFTDTNSGGMTSLVPGLGAFAAKAKNDAFGSIGLNLDPVALAKGQAQMASASLSDGLKEVGSGLKNFGTLFDFSNPQKLGYKGLVENLQKQGLADSVGINDGIDAAGYDPTKLSLVPDTVLHDVLTGVTGNDLAKIISQTGVTKAGTYETAADLVDPTKTMSPGAVAALGLKPGSGIIGLKSLGNTMTNIGVPMDAASAANLMDGIQTKVGGYLSGIKDIIPQSVKSGLGPILGTGSSPFGTPSMSDMMGSLAGAHTDDFNAANTQLTSIATSTQGQALTSAMSALQAACLSGVGIAAALSALQSASTSFVSTAVGNPNMASALASINSSMSSVSSHLALETSNLSLAGLNLSSPPTSPVGSAQILAFASKLHSFGVDKLQIGHADIFTGAATNDLTGDAIKASLLEGRNVAAMVAVGKTPPTVSNLSRALSAANEARIDSLIQNYNAAYLKYLAARSAMLANPTAATISASDTALTKLTNAQNKMMDAAATASDKAKQKVATAMEGKTLNPLATSGNTAPHLTFKGFPSSNVRS
jgi:hypothetical protein